MADPLPSTTTEKSAKKNDGLGLKAAGNKFFKSSHFERAVDFYTAATRAFESEVGPSFGLVASESNLAAALLVCGRFADAEAAADRGLVAAKAWVDDGHVETDKLADLVEKLKSRRSSARGRLRLEVEIAECAIDSLMVSPDRPATMGGILRQEIFGAEYEDIPFVNSFVMGQFKTATYLPSPHSFRIDPGRFLVTVNVFTCIAVFAWHPGDANTPAIGFGAHVPVGTVLDGSLRKARADGSRDSRSTIPEMSDALRKAFKDIDKSDRSIQVIVLGGHASVDHNFALANYHPNSEKRQRFSWHVLDAIRGSGLDLAIDTTLLNVFEGSGLITSPAMEMELRAQNQRFVVAALDLVTGRLLVDTEHRSAASVPDVVWQTERSVMASIRMGGAPMVEA